jgi:putative ABC transport system permease protein
MLVAVSGRILAIIQLVLKRSLNNSRLLLAAFVGLLIAVCLVSSVPLYTHGMLERLLRVRLESPDKRPSGTVWLRHLEDSQNHATLDQYKQLDSYVTNNVGWIVSIPLQQYVRYVAGDVYVFWPAENKGFIPQAQRRYGYVAFQSDLMKHVKVIDGQGLTDDVTPAGDDIPVVINQTTADELHLKVGDRLIYSDVEQYNPNGVIVKIVGLWQPLNPSEEYWIYDPFLFNNVLFTNERNLFDRVFTQLTKAPHEFTWYALFDASSIHTINESRVLSGLQFLFTRANIMMPGVTEYPTLMATLGEFQDRAFLLNLLLFVLSVPMIVVVLYYIGTSIGMIIDRQRNEIALLKSRGASTLQIVSIYLSEGLMLGVFALIVGPLIGMGVAELIGDSYGFLLFAQRPPLPLWLDEETVRYAVGAVVLSVLAALIPAVGAARHSIVSYKQEVARSSSRPIWQRFFVDFLLLAVAGYGYRLLSQNQSIINVTQAGTDPAHQQKLFIDPLTLLVPSVAIFGAALLFLRVFPVLSAGMSRVANLIAGASIVLALRQIARTPRHYSSLVLLLTMTLALGAFSASAAHTIDRNFSEQVYYKEPADLTITEAWDYDQAAGVWHEPPLEAHQVKGVQAFSTWNSFTVVPQQGNNQPKAQLLGVDRLTAPQVLWWRSDFAREPLGALMNALGISEQAILVQPQFLEQTQLHVGDTLTLLFDTTPVDFYIADTFTEFPTLYPDQGFIFVANLSYVNDQIGLQPYKVWMKLDPDVRVPDVIDALAKNGVRIIEIDNSRLDVNSSRLDPQRTGLFGVLSVGFVVAAVLTVLGFFLYSFLSFERRLLQMGILRAMGLSVRQLFGLLMFEQIYLIILGVAVGTGLGVYAGRLFIPFFQISTGFANAIPPFIVETAWADVMRIYIILGIMLALGLLSTAVLIARMRLYRTVKLGEES